MSDGKAVVYNGKKAMKVDFTSYGSSKIISSPQSEERFEGVLVIFNSNEQILRKDPDNISEDSEVLLEGLSVEVSNSLTQGWQNCYYCSFERYGEYSIGDLPSEFTTLDSDKRYCYGQNKLMAKYINSNKPLLKKVKFVGVVSQSELDFFVDSLEDVNIDLDSTYLVVV
jgi:hypothetical protein